MKTTKEKIDMIVGRLVDNMSVQDLKEYALDKMIDEHCFLYTGAEINEMYDMILQNGTDYSEWINETEEDRWPWFI